MIIVQKLREIILFKNAISNENYKLLSLTEIIDNVGKKLFWVFDHQHLAQTFWIASNLFGVESGWNIS